VATPAGAAATHTSLTEVLNLLEAGVSKEVIKAYIESSPVVSRPTSAEIIALKNRGLPDDLTTALLKRSTQLQAEGPQAGATGATGSPAQNSPAPAAPQPAQRLAPRPLDPESYDYFQRFYLYPRSVAYSYRLGYYAAYRLGYYAAPYGYGYYPPYQAAPYNSPWLAHPYRFGFP
jgi:hypothetical protein